MIYITLSDLRNKIDFFNIDDIAVIKNGRKKEEIGYFVPKVFEKDFKKFILQMQKKRKREILKKVLEASRKDVIEEGTIADGIE